MRHSRDTPSSARSGTPKPVTRSSSQEKKMRIGEASVVRAVAASAILFLALRSSPARAETSEITIAKEFGIGYLPYMIMEHEKLVEKHAKQRDLGNLKVNWKTFGGSGFQQSAIIAGQLEFVSSGVPWFLLLWDKMNGEVKSAGALDSMPLYLNTRDPKVKSLKEFSEKNKIAVPAIKSSVQAMTLQMAALKVFGPGQANKLDTLTVSLSHPDAMTALLSGAGGIDSHFTSPPFQDLELKDPQIHRVLSSYEVLDGAATFIITATTGKFQKANPKTFESFVAALEEARDGADLSGDVRGQAAVVGGPGQDARESRVPVHAGARGSDEVRDFHGEHRRTEEKARELERAVLPPRPPPPRQLTARHYRFH